MYVGRCCCYHFAPQIHRTDLLADKCNSDSVRGTITMSCGEENLPRRLAHSAVHSGPGLGDCGSTACNSRSNSSQIIVFDALRDRDLCGWLGLRTLIAMVFFAASQCLVSNAASVSSSLTNSLLSSTSKTKLCRRDTALRVPAQRSFITTSAMSSMTLPWLAPAVG